MNAVRARGVHRGGAEGGEGAGSGQQEGRGGVFMPRGGRTARGAPSPVLW